MDLLKVTCLFAFLLDQSDQGKVTLIAEFQFPHQSDGAINSFFQGCRELEYDRCCRWRQFSVLVMEGASGSNLPGGLRAEDLAFPASIPRTIGCG